jgi:hypothetical protein
MVFLIFLLRLAEDHELLSQEQKDVSQCCSQETSKRYEQADGSDMNVSQ